MRIWAMKKQTQTKPIFKRDDGFSAYYTRDCHGAIAAHYANLDYRQTSFEPGTRCAFQITKLVAKGLSNIDDKIISIPLIWGRYEHASCISPITQRLEKC